MVDLLSHIETTRTSKSNSLNLTVHLTILVILTSSMPFSSFMLYSCRHHCECMLQHAVQFLYVVQLPPPLWVPQYMLFHIIQLLHVVQLQHAGQLLHIMQLCHVVQLPHVVQLLHIVQSLHVVQLLPPLWMQQYMLYSCFLSCNCSMLYSCFISCSYVMLCSCLMLCSCCYHCGRHSICCIMLYCCSMLYSCRCHCGCHRVYAITCCIVALVLYSALCNSLIAINCNLAHFGYLVPHYDVMPHNY